MTLVERMQELLEAERAGVICLEQLAFRSEDKRLNQLFTQLRNDEGKFCMMLHRLILERQAVPGGAVGAFAEKVMALEDMREQVALLVKGQEWVVRKIAELPQEELNEEETQFFTEMRVAHARNCELCRMLLR